MLGYFGENGAESANAQGFVPRNRYVMASFGRLASQADVAPCLARLRLAESAELNRKIFPTEVAGKLHTTIISSRTKWRRIIFGRSPSSK